MFYNNGHSEELLGRAMKGRRERFVVATKIGWVGFDGNRGCSAYDSVPKLVEGVESGLRRLQTDHLDLMQCHVDFREPNMEIFVAGFQKLQRDGKIRAYGVSTGDFECLKAFNADGHCATLQIDYSLLNRLPEAEIFPYCQKNKIGVIVRGPLAMGILTGKLSTASQFGEGDFRQNWLTDPKQRAVFEQDLAKVEKLRPLATDRTMAQLALQFALSHPAVSTVIPGAKTPAQVADNTRAALLSPLTPANHAALDAITPPGGGRKIWPA